MTKMLYQAGWFVGLVLLQTLVLNQMHIGGYATPFFYIYLILKMHTRMGRNALMLWGFLLGLTVDVFSDTLGMNAAAATCLAFWRTPLLGLVTLRNADEDYSPGIRSIGVAPFFRYVLLASALFCSLLLLMDTFSLFNLPVLLLKMVSSTLTTVACIFCAEYIGGKRSEKRF